MAGVGLGACGGAGGFEDERDAGALRAAADVFAKLKDVNCPLLEGLHISEPTTILELLCSPSKYRLEILEWLCTRVCPSWQDKSDSLKMAPAEVKIQEMVKLGHELMLCGLDDHELLKGRACAQKQLQYLDQLIDAVRSQTFTYTGHTSVTECFDDTGEKNEALLGDLFSSPHLQSLLSPTCDPWPLNMQSDEWSSASPAEDVEERKVAELARQLQESANQLRTLRAEGAPLAAESRIDSSTLAQKLRLVVSDFHQLVVAFLQVYDDELRVCCQRSSPFLHPCGPVVQAVYQMLTSCSQLLKAIMEVADTSVQAMEMVKQQQSQQICWGGSSYMMSLAAKMEELTQKYKVVRDRLPRAPTSQRLCGRQLEEPASASVSALVPGGAVGEGAEGNRTV
ncbi:HAUS augmin-like complex subunit 7 [Erinaceus europaeus]|uniref:HAUS augmin-like complex subunit 7 n=1 Tax=Erinaceus europaeus TaxID=9365 RepID=A0ABM3WSN7_ERIEU|nr:HAUS augmin-like complex subunit 7 [Erinaceus europaeus]